VELSDGCGSRDHQDAVESVRNVPHASENGLRV
jgi:hypothetical protein